MGKGAQPEGGVKDPGIFWAEEGILFFWPSLASCRPLFRNPPRKDQGGVIALEKTSKSPEYLSEDEDQRKDPVGGNRSHLGAGSKENQNSPNKSLSSMV